MLGRGGYITQGSNIVQCYFNPKMNKNNVPAGVGGGASPKSLTQSNVGLILKQTKKFSHCGGGGGHTSPKGLM